MTAVEGLKRFVVTGAANPIFGETTLGMDP